MEKEVLERAFEAFYTTKPAGKGTGLGLSLCYSIMRNHGGSIEIESTPGVGTCVRAYFPIKEIE
jgi:signal transduction histidine kinase